MCEIINFSDIPRKMRVPKMSQDEYDAFEVSCQDMEYGDIGAECEDAADKFMDINRYERGKWNLAWRYFLMQAIKDEHIKTFTEMMTLTCRWFYAYAFICGANYYRKHSDKAWFQKNWR